MAKKKLGLGNGLGQFRQMVKELTILPELKILIPPLVKDELDLLRESIKKEGVREPIDIWVNDGENVIIDGHNRYNLATEEKVSFTTKEHLFKSIEEVKEWMLKKQLGRRNLSDASRTYLIGLLYNKAKEDKGGDRIGAKSNVQNLHIGSRMNTAERIASETGSSVRSVKNAGDYASGLDKMVPELKQHVLSGEKKVTKAEIQDLAKVKTDKPIQNLEELKNEVNKVKKSKKEKREGSKLKGKGITVDQMNDNEYLEHYMAVKDEFQNRFKEVDELVLYSVLNDFLGFRSNLTDLIKLANGGYTILRVADTPSIHIKYFTTERNSWKILEKGFKSRTDRDKRLKELLKDNKTIRG